MPASITAGPRPPIECCERSSAHTAMASEAAGRLDAAESQLARFAAQPHERTETVRIHLVRGLLKKPYLGYSRSPSEMAMLRAVKSVLDPNNILNPGKIFD